MRRILVDIPIDQTVADVKAASTALKLADEEFRRPATACRGILCCLIFSMDKAKVSLLKPKRGAEETQARMDTLVARKEAKADTFVMIERHHLASTILDRPRAAPALRSAAAQPLAYVPSSAK